MVKLSLSILLFLLASLLLPEHTFAQTDIQAPLTVTVTLDNVKVDNRVKVLHDYLMQYNSPLADKAYYFIKTADEYNIDWKLVPAIAGVESYFGEQRPEGTYNSFGFNIYDGNERYFTSDEDAISTVTKALRKQYINQWKAKDVYQIGSLYAADPEWANKVQHFMDDIDNYNKVNSVKTLSLSI